MTPFELYAKFANMASAEKQNLMQDIPKAASQQAANWFPDQTKGWDNQKDAARHALWSANLATQYGKLPARAMTTAWELPGILMGDPSTKMDLYNNATGIEMSDQFANWQELMNAIQTEAELAEAKQVGLFDTGPGLITIPESKYGYKGSMY